MWGNIGRSGGGGARITSYENKELNLKNLLEKHSAKNSLILHRSTGRAD